MATLIGEARGRSYTAENRTRTFIVEASSRDEYAEDILAVVPVSVGQWHPKSFGYFAKTPDVRQDPKAWWKWTVDWNYARIETNEDPVNNPDQNPLLEDPDISIDFQTIEVDSKGELQEDGTYKSITNSANEPFDPAPREELELMLISITRNEAPDFSVKKLRQFQNGVNDDVVLFGDDEFAEGTVKIRIRVSERQKAVLEVSQTVIEYRSYNYTLAINPLGWDIELLDWGPSYIDGNGTRRFFAEEASKEFGLLDGSGAELADGAAPFFISWKNKERVDFDELTLPSGP